MLKRTTNAIYQAFLLIIDLLMFVTKNRQKLYRFDQISDGGVFEI